MISLTSIPQELIEHILVFAASQGDPSAAARLARTCRLFNSRIDNRHLWRLLFLAVFGDPNVQLDEYDWKEGFVMRMQAARLYRGWMLADGGNRTLNQSDNRNDDLNDTNANLHQTLHTLVAAATYENSPMPYLPQSILESESLAHITDNPLHYLSPHSPNTTDSDTLAYPLYVALYTSHVQRCARGEPNNDFQVIEKITSKTSQWVEKVFENGYLPVLNQRLRLFDAWIHRRPRPDTRAPSTIPKRTNHSNVHNRPMAFKNSGIIDDPRWELTPTGRLFYKLALLKGYLPTSTDWYVIHDERDQVRVKARRRVYDMCYLSKDRIWGPFLPINQDLSTTTNSNAQNPSTVPNTMASPSPPEDEQSSSDSSYVPSPSPPSSLSDLSNNDDAADESTQLHFDMLSLLMAGVDTHFLLAQNLIQPESNGDPNATIETMMAPQSQTGNNAHYPNTGISPHKVIPDYPFLAAARFLVEMNMREAFVNEFGSSSEDEDEDDDISDDDEVDLDEESSSPDVDIDVIPSSGNIEAIDQDRTETYQETQVHQDSSNSAQASSPSTADQQARDAILRDKKKEWIETLVDSFSAIEFVRMGPGIGLAGLNFNLGTDGPADKKGKGKETGGGGKYQDGWDWADVEGDWVRVVCWMDYQDLLLHSSGASTALSISTQYVIEEAIRIFPLQLRVTGYDPPPLRPSSSSTTDPPSADPGTLEENHISDASKDQVYDEADDPNAPIWHLPVIHFAGESRLSGAHGEQEAMKRYITGTVRMIGDGAVRWSMSSSRINNAHEAEWGMEGVQVGCAGSVAGVVGMWTGVEHVRGDPIGPCWQWKVGQTAVSD
ncbi:hypothetical protein AMATHDRAFT_5794 [Amanita thiersii Skay4041]|uniref:F-box domain-containing protein n=1 Tax=Amanita thiersii Skay4041 TaxID=703135 RepID=A0A2A9NL29_9AGAR|nr:hypothetical protein AMATHDRAFT_5794 [Amanita thiersii Skay4041]